MQVELKSGAPRKCHSASSCKCCRESVDPTHFVTSLGYVCSNVAY